MLIKSPQYVRLLPQAHLEIKTGLILEKKPFIIFKNLEKNKKIIIQDYYYSTENELIIRIFNFSQYKTENQRLFAITKDMFELQKGEDLCEIKVVE